MQYLSPLWNTLNENFKGLIEGVKSNMYQISESFVNQGLRYVISDGIYEV